jgi:hypothetical protein
MFPGGCPARRARPGGSPGMPGAACAGRAVPEAREPPAITVTAGGAPVSGTGARARVVPQALAVRAVPGHGDPAVPRGLEVHGARQVAGARTIRVAGLARAVIRVGGRGAGTTRTSRKPGPHGAGGHGGTRTPAPGQTRRRREMRDAWDPGDAQERTGARDRTGVLAREAKAAPGLGRADERAAADGLSLADERGWGTGPGQRGGRQPVPARAPG